MTKKEQYQLFCIEWNKTHSLSKPPSYKSFIDYYLKK